MRGFELYLVIHIILTICFIGAYYSSGFSHEKKKCEEMQYIARKYRRIAIFLLLIGYVIYIIFATFRPINYEVGGRDALQYKRIFESAYQYSFFEFNFLRKEEIGYNLITWTIRRFTNNFCWVLFIMHTIAYYSLAKSYKYIYVRKNGFILCLYTFLIIGWLFSTFNTLRFGVALSLATLFFVNLEREEYKKAILIIVLCLLFHTAAIVLVFPLALCVLKTKYGIRDNKKFIPLVILGIGIELLIIPRLSTIISLGVYGEYDSSGGIAIGTFMIIIFTIILIAFKNYQNGKNFMLSNNFLILLCALFCIPIQMQYSVAYRMVVIFMPSLYKSLLELSTFYRISKKTNFYCIIVVAITFVYFIYRAFSLYTVDFISDGLFSYY